MITGLISFYLATMISQTKMIKPVAANPAPYRELLTVAPMPTPAPIPFPTAKEEKKGETEKPHLSASAYLALDLQTATTLISKNAAERRSIGSITKLMTALIVLTENNPNDIVTVPREATKVDGSRIWLAEGEKITVRDLLYGMLIHSGNDAAYTLAIYNSGSVEAFVKKMNKKAEQLELTGTHFGNPAGLDRADNYSTAQDIALLASFAYRESFIRHVVGISSMTIKSVNGKFTHELKNTNILLEKDPRFKGFKTGHTLEAGYSFVGLALLKNNTQILTVVLDSPDRFKESQMLVDWAQNAFIW